MNYKTTLQTSHHRIDDTYFQNLIITGNGDFDWIDISIKQKNTTGYTLLLGEEKGDKIFHHNADNHTGEHFLSIKNINGFFNTTFMLKGIFNHSEIIVDCKYDVLYNRIDLPSRKQKIKSLILLLALLFAIFVGTSFKNQYKWYTRLVFSTLLSSIVLFCYVPPDGKVILNCSLKNPNYISFDLMEYRFEKYLSGLLHEFEENYQKDKSIINAEFSPSCRCNFKPLNYTGNSSPRDLIITSGVGELKNIKAFVRSIRTANCKATIVAITDSDPIKELADCGVVFIKINVIDGDFNKKRIRWTFITEFLNIIDPNSFDRIIYADLFDSVFQADPFTAEFTKGKLLLSDEEEKVAVGYFFTKYRNEYYGFDFSTWTNQTIFCSGLFGVEFEKGKTLFNIIGHMLPNYYDLEFELKDQHLFNTIIHSPFFQDIGLEPIVFKHGGNFSSIYKRADYYTIALPSEYTTLHTYPAVLHHTYRNGLDNYSELICSK